MALCRLLDHESLPLMQRGDMLPTINIKDDKKQEPSLSRGGDFLYGSMKGGFDRPTTMQASVNRLALEIESHPHEDGASEIEPNKTGAQDELPTNVNSRDILDDLPTEFRSLDPNRPLRHVDSHGDQHTYVFRPMFYSAIFILSVELLERFGYYGLLFTETAFLTGVYTPKWSPNLTAVTASSYVSISILVAYASTFVGAVLADSFLGDYWTITLGVTLFYIPGLLFVALTTIPGLLGENFNTPVLMVAIFVLWPLGTGLIKSLVNVFGAKQFHPLLQAAMVERYYILFYMAINIGALAGGILIPIVAEYDIIAAYFIPVSVLTFGFSIFLLGTSRYVRGKPPRNMFSKQEPSIEGRPSVRETTILEMFGLTMLIVPFCVVFYQMTTTYIVQGTVMRPALGFLDASTMPNTDSVSVLVNGYLIGSVLYPWLRSRGIHLATTHKYAIGTFFTTLSISWTIMVEYMIHYYFDRKGEKISVLWQIPSYYLVGCGEIFAIAATYEVAFRTASPNRKALASAINLFVIGGITNTLCTLLYKVCAPWFRNDAGNSDVKTIELYTQAHMYYYFWVLSLIAVVGIGVNLLPFVHNWVERVERQASENAAPGGAFNDRSRDGVLREGRRRMLMESRFEEGMRGGRLGQSV